MKFEQFLIDNSNCVPQQSSEDSTTHPMAETVPSPTFGWVPEKRKLNCIIMMHSWQNWLQKVADS